MDVQKILRQMSAEEKAALVSGTDFMYTNPIPRLHIPSLCTSDGPHGLRKQTGNSDNGISESEPATAFPTAAAVGCGWNPDNAREIGKAIAEECRWYGVHTLLGPGVNIKRNPLCGRNFEYFSEDPLLSGVMGAAEVQGLQENGIAACVKHFALNNAENYRFMGNSVVSENTMRKLYLKPFEYIVRHAHPAAIMCAYNRINGVWCSENRWLLNDVLRKEWGFDGIVMTDWGAVHDRVKGLQAGLDLEMPGDTAVCRKQILDGLKDGSLKEEDLNLACANLLTFIDRYVKDEEKTPVDWQAHHQLAGKIAADCAVLLKNDGILPLSKETKIHAEGELFANMRYQGAGSSMIHARQLTSVKQAFEGKGIRTDYSIEECDVILVCAGLRDEYESEGCDRKDMKLPQDQLKLIDQLTKTDKPLIVVLFTGSPVELPFAEEINGLLNMYLPGENGGSACVSLLYGDVNPSGKLAETWPLRYEDVPSAKTFSKSVNEIYREGLEVGYRYYESHRIPVRYPFGFGLSYTSFRHSKWEKEGDVYTQTVTNTGNLRGKEVCILMEEGELRGFVKVELEPGETKTVSVIAEEKDTHTYSDTYALPEEVPSLPITMDSRFSDLKQTFFGRILFHAVLSVAHRQEKEAEKMEEGAEKENKRKGARFLRNILESNSLHTMSMSAGKNLPYNVACGMKEMANGHVIRSLKYFMSAIKVPDLPGKERRK